MANASPRDIVRRPKLTAALAVVAACLLGVAVARTVRTPAPPAPTASPRALGHPDARVRITEYVDYQCQSCRLAAGILKDITTHFPGEIYLEVFFNPLPSHLHGALSAAYASCAADKKKFWAFHEPLLERQNEWMNLPDPRPLFDEIARSAGLDPGKLRECAERDETRQKVAKEREESFARGINATPTFFVNGKMTIGHQGLQKELDAYFPRKDQQD